MHKKKGKGIYEYLSNTLLSNKNPNKLEKGEKHVP